MADPLTALMYAVQVMNFLRMLILKALKERQQSTVSDTSSVPDTRSSDGNEAMKELSVAEEASADESAATASHAAHVSSGSKTGRSSNQNH